MNNEEKAIHLLQKITSAALGPTGTDGEEFDEAMRETTAFLSSLESE